MNRDNREESKTDALFTGNGVRDAAVAETEKIAEAGRAIGEGLHHLHAKRKRKKSFRSETQEKKGRNR